jgi:hypothetical protein
MDCNMLGLVEELLVELVLVTEGPVLRELHLHT